MLLIVAGVLVVGLGVLVLSRGARAPGTGRAATLGRVNNLASGVVVVLIGLGLVFLGVVDLV